MHPRSLHFHGKIILCANNVKHHKAGNNLVEVFFGINYCQGLEEKKSKGISWVKFHKLHEEIRLELNFNGFRGKMNGE